MKCGLGQNQGRACETALGALLLVTDPFVSNFAPGNLTQYTTTWWYNYSFLLFLTSSQRYQQRLSPINLLDHLCNVYDCVLIFFFLLLKSLICVWVYRLYTFCNRGKGAQGCLDCQFLLKSCQHLLPPYSLLNMMSFLCLPILFLPKVSWVSIISSSL